MAGASFWSPGFRSHRALLWVPILLIPFVLPRSVWVGTFLIFTLLSSALINVSNPLWMAWITDLVPADNRGRYFGTKNMYGGLTGMIVSVLGGAFLDAATKRHLYAEPVAFAIIFGVSCVFAFPSLPICLRCPDPGEAKAGGATRIPLGVSGAIMRPRFRTGRSGRSWCFWPEW